MSWMIWVKWSVDYIVSFLRFCCSFNGKANVTDGHAQFSINCGLVAGMPAETSQRPSGVTFSLPRILIMCSGTVHICNEHESNVVSYIIPQKGRQKMWVEDGHMTKWLHSWHMLDNLNICIVCVWKACWRPKQNSKDCQAFFSQWCCFLLFLKKSTFLVSFLLSFRWLSVLSNVLSEISTRSTVMNVYGDMLDHFVTGMPAGTLSQRPSGVDEGSYQSSSCTDVCSRLRTMKTTLNTAWKLVKESNVVWCGLHWTDLLWCPLLFCLIFSGQLTCRCTSWVSAKTFRHSFPASKGNR